MTQDHQLFIKGVDYAKLNDLGCDLATLERETHVIWVDFLEELETLLLEAEMVQAPEFVVAHMAAFLSVCLGILLGSDAPKYKNDVMIVLKSQSTAALKQLLQLEGDARRPGLTGKGNMRHSTKTVRSIMAMMQSLADNTTKYDANNQQEEHFAPLEPLLGLCVQAAAAAKIQYADILPSNHSIYAANQLAIYFAWVVAQFWRLTDKNNPSPDILEYATGTFEAFFDTSFKLLSDFAQSQHEAKASEYEETMAEVSDLSSKVNAQHGLAVTDNQKAVAQMSVEYEKAVIDALADKVPYKVVVMSLFTAWFQIDAPLRVSNLEKIDDIQYFEHLTPLLGVVKKCIDQLPEPDLDDDIVALNEKMDTLKSIYPMDDADQVDLPRAKLSMYANQINTALFSLTKKFLDEDTHPELIANVIFHRYIRLYCTVATDEADWQKVDYYFPEVMGAVRDYLSKLA